MLCHSFPTLGAGPDGVGVFPDAAVDIGQLGGTDTGDWVVFSAVCGEELLLGAANAGYVCRTGGLLRRGGWGRGRS